ncbi:MULTISPECIES: phosphotransferase [unclassified Streptomyces]|uniref:phosphotransferase n=1 Tax=unclassified Streptomyces TaxID=2593676 RepID=UPI0038104995
MTAAPVPGPPYRHQGPLPDLTTEDLREPVRTLLGDPTAEVSGWTGEPICYESWSRASDGLYAVRGTASGDGDDRAWEMVLKQVRHRTWVPGPHDLGRQIDDGGDGPADWAYWRREALVLGSSLPYALADRFTAVRCLGIVPGPGDRLRLWLERADGTPGEAWTARELLDSAEFLGGFHARSLRRPPPSREWWCRPFLEQAALHARFALIERVADAETSADPAVRGLFRPGTATALRSLARRHAEAVRTVRSLPTGLVHRDLTPRNLFRTARGTVAIDWGQAGLGPAGEDLATLVLSSAVAADLDADATLALGDAAATRHATGMAEEGGPCDPEDVALAYRLVAAYHFGLPVVRLADRLLARDAAYRAETAADPGTRRRAAVMTALVEEAQRDL